MHSKEWYDINKDKQVTITLSYENWDSIWSEAEGHLNYWGEGNESVDRLRDLLDEFEKGNN